MTGSPPVPPAHSRRRQPGTDDRRARGRACVLVASVLALAGLSPSVQAADSAPGSSTGSGDGYFDYRGAKLGAHVRLDAHNGWEELSAVRNFEANWERQSDLLRVYVDWNPQSLFTPAQTTLAEEGRTMLLSWSPYGHGQGVQWSEIADGRHDAEIDARAAEIVDFGHPIVFTFQHEPDNQVDLPTGDRAGTATDFCNAYRRVVDRFRAAGVTNVTYGVILMAWTALTGDPEEFYCGDGYVDYLGVDGYNWYGCVQPDGPWRMPADIFGAWYEWARAHDKPLVIAEWGTGEDPQVKGRKAKWIRSLRVMVKEWPEIKAALIFNAAPNPNCPRYSDTSRSAQRAFVKMGADRHFR